MDLDQKAHSLRDLTAPELREYRRALEHSLKVLSPDAPVRALLRRKLAEVLAEQETRTELE